MNAKVEQTGAFFYQSGTHFLQVEGRTCEKVWHVGVQVFNSFHGALKEKDSVIIAVEEPLEGVSKVPIHTDTQVAETKLVDNSRIA